MVFNYLSISKLQRCSHGRLGIDIFIPHFTVNVITYPWSILPMSLGLFYSLHYSDECDSNHQPQDCLLNRLFRHRSKKTSKLRVTGLCEGNSPVIGEFPTQRTSNAENVSIWWRHHGSYISSNASVKQHWRTCANRFHEFNEKQIL